MQLRSRKRVPSWERPEVPEVPKATMSAKSETKYKRLGEEKGEGKEEQEKPKTGGVDMAGKLGLFTLAGFCIVLFQVTCEVGKQISNYSLQYYNQGHYPMPQTVLVITTEVLKLAVTIVRSGFKLPSMKSSNLRGTLKFLLPSLLYAINNNIYYAGLMLVPPPIWLILCSFRTVVTASLYKFVLKQPITPLQFLGALLIVLSIVVAKIGDVFGTTTTPAIPPAAFLLAVIASCNSVGAAVYTERLFKKEGENFLDQQFWLYLYGIVVGCGVHVISNSQSPFSGLTGDLSTASSLVKTLLVSALIFGGVGGLVVAAILKRLDNIVKEYSGATANIFTALVSSFLFPERFQFTRYIVMAMMLLFTGIFLYETKKAKKPTSQSSEKESLLPNKPATSNTEVA